MMELTDNTIDAFISADTALILLSTSWCGHCAKAMEDMRMFEKSTGVPCGWINIQRNHKTLMKYFGRGVPEFLFFSNGSVVKQVKGTGDLMEAFKQELERYVP